MRHVQAASAAGDRTADTALQVYVHQIRHYLGAYLVELGGADAIVFTAGVGENDASIRAAVCDGLARLGIVIKPKGNGANKEGAELRQGMIRAIESDSRANIARIWALERAVKCGRGAYRILKTYANDGDNEFMRVASLYLCDKSTCTDKI
jgi:acetate kinase